MIQLGPIEIPSRLLLAPVAGYSDSPFRKIARRHGAGLTVTELISAEGIVRRHQKTLDMMAFSEEERPLGIQIFGNKPEVMAEAAAIAEEVGPDFIDINLGCPAKKVCKSGSGAALLLDPMKISDIASGMVKRVKVPVSAKIRIGWDTEHMTYRDVIRSLEDAGISILFVHGRTRSQFYSGQADWETIRDIKELSRLPVVGNGDILTHEEAHGRLSESGCDAVMIGRAAFGNPWIFSGKIPSRQELVSQMEEHMDLMLEHFGDRGLILIRKHFAKYIHDLRNAKKYRAVLMRASDREEVRVVLNDIVNG